ncbi:MAG: TonB-dependent receptor [Flaviaesturariibacter sp.]|nr:TonB-dependent receptor [Flaviaesturariibacter sp.]
MLKAFRFLRGLLFLLLMKRLLPLLLFSIGLLFTATGFSQTKISIRATNHKKEPVSFATVSILNMGDSLQTQQKLTDSSGVAIFDLATGGQYTVQISSINYETLRKGITITKAEPIFSFVLANSAKTLNTVVVRTSAKPTIRQEDDKTIVDPENLAASSTNAFEIMEKTPGLFVDQDGNIYLNSTTPATVHINGREQKMSTADIATMLKSLPPNSIASIEILRTPSARYDASGGGGIVNVILKKGVKIGLTGSVNGGFNQGRFGNQFLGLNLNNNNGKLTTYINLQASRRNNFEQIKTDRQFRPDSVLSQDAYTKYPAQSYYFGYGASYQLNKKWDLSYDGRFNYNNSRNNSTNHSTIRQISTGNMAGDNYADVANKSTNFNLTQGFSAKYKIDSAGSEWNTDLSFTYSPNNTDQSFLNTYFFPVKPQTTFTGEIDNDLKFFSAQTNFIKKLPKQLTMEAGVKSTMVRFQNTTKYAVTSAYDYKENINAGYLQASKSFLGIVVKVGTRLENTNMKGHQLSPKDTSFNLQRTDLFPYVYLSRNLMKIAGYDLRAYLVYRRTINRPAYEYLNPYPRRVDQYLFESGNPTLRPQFTQNYEANVSFEERPILAIGVNDTKDIFTQVVYQPDSSSRQVAFRTYDNLGKNKEMYFRALGAVPPGKRYFFVAGAQYNRNYYQGFYEGKPLSFRRGSWSFFTYQTFKITPLMQISLNGFIRLNGQQQFYELGTFGSLNLNLSQQFFNKKLVVTLSGNDLFYTNQNDFNLKQGSVTASGFRRGDTRRFGLNLRYNFGFRKKEENNLFNVESPDKQ